MSWLVLGIGNPLRGDDGAGRRVADLVAAQHWPGVEVRSLHQLTPELSEDISRAEGVVFVDAAHGENPGQVYITSLSPKSVAAPFSHHLDVQALLALAATLYGRCPPAWLATITGERFERGEEISAVIQQAIPGLVSTLRSILRQGVCEMEQLPVLRRQ